MGKILILLLFVSIISPTEGDGTENWIKKHVPLFRKAPKLWYRYARSFTHNQLKHAAALSKFGLTEFQSNHLLSLLVFRQINSPWMFFNQLRNLTLLKQQSLFADISIPIFRSVSIQSRVLLATGQLLLNSELQPSTHPIYQQYCNENGFITLDDCQKLHLKNHVQNLYSIFNLVFEPDKKLGLNFSFSIVEFTSGSGNFGFGNTPCQLGLLRITYSKNIEKPLEFCGQLSEYSVFPFSPELWFSLVVYPSTLFEIHSTFMVRDKGKVISIALKFQEHCIVCSVGLLYPTGQSTTFLSVTKMQVNKHRKLVAQLQACNEINFLVLDGPWHLSKRVSPLRNFYYISSFLTVVLTQRSLLTKEKCSLTFTSKQIKSTQLKYYADQQVLIPSGTICPHRPQLCVVDIHNTNKLHMNLTVTHLSYKGKKSNTCSFGGFVTAQHLEDEFRENPILCNDIDRTVWSDFRSFYSSGSPLVAILYIFFPFVSSVEVRLTLSATRCKSINICPCKLHVHCMHVKSNNSPEKPEKLGAMKSTGTPECLSVFRQLKNTNIVSGSLQNGETYLLRPKINTCVIIQIARLRHCVLKGEKFISETGFKTELFVHTSCKGATFHMSVKGMLFQTLNRKTCCKNFMYKCGHINCLYINKDRTTISQQFSGGARLNFAKTFIDDLNFALIEPFNAANWVDIQVSVVKKLMINSSTNSPVYSNICPEVSSLGFSKNVEGVFYTLMNACVLGKSASIEIV